MYLTQSLHRAMQQHANATMTMFGDRSRTVAESVDRIARLAGALRALGARPGDRIGYLGLNSDRYHEFLFAVAWADLVATPVNFRWSPVEVAYSMLDSDTRILFVDDTFAAAVPAVRSAGAQLSATVFCGDGPCPEGLLDFEEMLSGSDPIEDNRRGGDALCGIFYTGGTTGNPKGVMISHDGLMIGALGGLSTSPFITPGGRLLHAAPLFHLAGLAAWVAGNVVNSTHVILPSFSASAVAHTIAEHRVTDILLVPTMLQMLVDDPAAAGADFSSVRSVIYGASPISDAVLVRVRDAFPDAGLTQAYGMTELSPCATMLQPADHDDQRLTRSAGRAISVMELRTVDEDDNDVPTGQVGEIVVRGDNVMRGYWNRPEETAEALRGGWMHTGDLGYLDADGYLFLVDRAKDMIITGGENVYSSEVENALADHPAVAAVAVIGVPDEQWGERVHAVVVRYPGSDPSPDELTAHCRSTIAGYKVPRSFEFVEALPLSGAGKVLKKDLRAPHWAAHAHRVS